jgi:hypothetical protein
MAAIVVGPVEVSAVDGHVHVALGARTARLTPRATDDLIHALHEALEAAR